MNLPKNHFQYVIFILLCFGIFWLMFTLSAHLLLDLEESKQFYRSKVKTALDFAAIDADLDSSEDEEVFVSNKPKCDIPFDTSYPDCENQVQRLRDTWTNDPCFKLYDIDGSDCSIIIYLSEVEAWCPRLPWRKHMKKKVKRREKAELQENIDQLMLLLTSNSANSAFRTRSLHSWKDWKSGFRLMKKSLLEDDKRFVKKIFVYIGELADQPLSNDTTNLLLTDSLLQWSDLVTSLYILGHKMTIASDRRQLVDGLLPKYRKKRCNEQNPYDLVFIDQVGMQHMTSLIPDLYNRILTEYGCKLRVVDSFGTDAEFNFAKYNDSLIPGGRSPFGNLELNLRQFMTRFYVSADNSFLGFAIGSYEEKRLFLRKTKRLVIFGDSSFIVKNETLSWLDFANKFMRIHYVPLQDGKDNQVTLPKYVIIHKEMKDDDIEKLVTKAKVVILFGESTERILPVFAVGKGCVFLNQKFNPPKDRTNTKHLKDKPSFRELSSQNPYLEKLVGKPHVITLDVNNQTEMKNAIRKISKTKVKTYIPFELTSEGFLQRLNAYVENQDFCQYNDWPPILELQIKIGLSGESCQDVCSKQGLECEPAYFQAVNSTKIHGCRKVITAESVIAPAKEVNSTLCLMQKQPFLYNCMRFSSHYRRICPCRTFKIGQRSLCEEC